MSWHASRLAAFDIETTGVDPESDRIVTAAVSVVGGGRPTESFAWLVDPGIEIPAGATAVHGITTAHARAEGMSSRRAVEEITDLLAQQVRAGVPIIAFNARFDLTTLDREARRHGVTPLADRVGGVHAMLVVDPYVVDKHYDRYRPGKRTLGAVCGQYAVPLTDAHAADADALAAARVAYRLAQRIPELREMPLPLLHRCQITWAAEQAASLEEHFHRQGRAEAIEREWPVVPQPVAAIAA